MGTKYRRILSENDFSSRTFSVDARFRGRDEKPEKRILTNALAGVK